MRRNLLYTILLSLLPLAVFFFASPTQASTTITVSSPLDVIANDGDCTLREAIIAVNTQTHSGIAGGECHAGTGNDTIILPSGTFSITITGIWEDGSLTGDFDITRSVTIQGAGTTCASPPNPLCTIVNGNTLDRVFDISTTAHITLSQMEIMGGAVGGGFGYAGGAIQNRGVLSLNHLLVIANTTTGDGGGLYNEPGATAIIDTMSFGNNSANSEGGSIYNSGTLTLTNVSFNGGSSVQGGIFANFISGNAALIDVTMAGGTSEYGGAIANGGNLVVNRGTFNDNEATTGSGGALMNFGSAAITNTTFARNHADAPGKGGGAIYEEGGAITLTNVTIANNSGDTSGGIYLYDGSVALKNTIVYFNPNGNCKTPLTSLGHNLEGADTCGFSATGDIVNANPHLGPLADNGGLTQTRALLPGSPAIDAGANIGCPSIDQRGAVRPIGIKCDIGAYEAGYVFLPLIRK